MKADTVKVSLNGKTRIHNKRKGRMKLEINLSTDEAESLNKYFEMLMPPGFQRGDFIKYLFLRGVREHEKEFQEAFEKYSEEHPEEIEKIKQDIQENVVVDSNEETTDVEDLEVPINVE